MEGDFTRQKEMGRNLTFI